MGGTRRTAALSDDLAGDRNQDGTQTAPGPGPPAAHTGQRPPWTEAAGERPQAQRTAGSGPVWTKGP